MSRILILAAVGLLLFGGTLAADQMLQNDDVEPADADDLADQQTYAESVAPFIEAAPVFLFVLAVGVVLVGVRAVGAR